MPIPVGLALMGAGGLAAGGAQAISGAFKSPYEKKQEEDLRKMREQQARGNRGLSEQAKSARHRANVDPAVKQMEDARRRSEALAAASGQASGAFQQRAMQAQQQGVGQLMQQSAMDIQMADERKAAEQEAREQQTAAAIEAARKERRERVLGGVGQMLGAAGMVAGSVPEATRAADVAGTPIRDPDAFAAALRGQGYDEDTIRKLTSMDKNQLTRTLKMVSDGELTTPDAQELDALLREDLLIGRQFPDGLGASSGYNLSAGLGYK